MSTIYAAFSPFCRTESATPETNTLDFGGEISFLVWEGVGNLVPKWKKSTGRVSQGYFYLEQGNEIVRWIGLNGDMRIRRIPEKWAFGKSHVLGLLPGNVSLKRAAEQADVVLFAVEDAAAAAKWVDHIQASQKELRQLTDLDHPGTIHLSLPLRLFQRQTWRKNPRRLHLKATIRDGSSQRQPVFKTSAFISMADLQN